MELPAPCSRHRLHSVQAQLKVSGEGRRGSTTNLLVQGDVIQTHAHLTSEEVGSIGTVTQEAPAHW